MNPRPRTTSTTLRPISFLIIYAALAARLLAVDTTWSGDPVFGQWTNASNWTHGVPSNGEETYTAIIGPGYEKDAPTVRLRNASVTITALGLSAGTVSVADGSLTVLQDTVFNAAIPILRGVDAEAIVSPAIVDLGHLPQTAGSTLRHVYLSATSSGESAAEIGWAGASISRIASNAGIALTGDGARIRNTDNDADALASLARNDGILSISDRNFATSESFENRGNLEVKNGVMTASGTLALAGNSRFLPLFSENFDEHSGEMVTRCGRIAVAGTLLLGGDFSTYLASYANGPWDSVSPSDVFEIASAYSIAGAFDNISTGDRFYIESFGHEPAVSFLFKIDGDSITLSDFQVVPEPGTYAFLFAGGVLLSLSRRRRKTVNQKVTLFQLAAFAATLISFNATAQIIDDGSSNYRPIASNIPDSGNVWNGLAQSFTAENPNILFGFRLKDANALLPNAGAPIVYNLYEGENSYFTLLATRTIPFPSAVSSDSRSVFGDVGFVDADFSSVSLTVGQKYTVEIAIPVENAPAEGARSGIGAWTSVSNPYQAGRFFFPAFESEFFSSDDMLFRAVAVPETEAVRLAALGLLLLWTFRKRQPTSIHDGIHT